MGKIIAIEGLDLTGKSTLVSLLQKALNCGLKKNFIEEHQEVSDLSSAKRELYYALLLHQERNTKVDYPLILDRYYPSVLHCGRVLNGQNSISNQLPLTYFKQPDLFVYLTCSFEEKIGRYKDRGIFNQKDQELLSSREFHDFSSSIYDGIIGRINSAYHNVREYRTDSNTAEEIVKSLQSIL